MVFFLQTKKGKMLRGMRTQTETSESVKIRSSVYRLCHILVCVFVGTETNSHLQCVHARTCPHTCGWILSFNQIHLKGA